MHFTKHELAGVFCFYDKSLPKRCMQVARFTTILTATSYLEVDETVYFKLEFPGGTLANCVSGYAKDLNHLKAKAKNGWF